MSSYVSPCRQSCYYGAVATVGSEQVVGKTFITPVGRRETLLVASARQMFVCVHKDVSTHPHFCNTCFQHLRAHTEYDRELECLLESGINGSIFCALVGTMCCQCAPNPHCQ